AGARLPLRVGDDALDAAVAIPNLELEPEREPLAVDVALAVEAEVAAVPAVAQHRADRVVAGAQQRCDVVCLVLEPAIVGRPTRREQLVPNALAVEIQLVQTETRCVDSRARDCTSQTKRTPEQRRWPTEAVGRAGRRTDPRGHPVGRLEQTGLPECVLA